MADVIQLLDGSVYTIFDERDAMELIDRYMGMEMRKWLEDWLNEGDDDAAYIDDLEKEAEGLRAYHKEVMAELRKQSETIAGLIREKEIDRKALSAAAGAIGCLTWRELR
jgi:ferritin-like metal-binding protein YciE